MTNHIHKIQATLVAHIFVYTVSFQCHEGHHCPICGHGISCSMCSENWVHSFPNSSIYFDSIVSFPTPPSWRSVSVLWVSDIAVLRNTTPAYNDGHLYGVTVGRSVQTAVPSHQDVQMLALRSC
jgi:hypothetical protein